MRRVRTYHPLCRITLHKLIGRSALQGTGSAPVSERFRGTSSTIDLTPYLTDHAGVYTHKSIYEPAGGFVLAFADRGHAQGGGLESLYGLVEPMDGIEIRMRHGPMAGSAGLDPARPPLVMRGFVSEVTRSEQMGPDGRPQRTVTISGQDYGKIWQMVQIRYFANYIVGQWLLSGFKLFERYGVAADAMPGSQLVREVVTKILDPYLAALVPAGGALPASFDLSGVTVRNGVTSLTGPQSAQGTIYDLLRTYLDVGAWNELFMEDTEQTVRIVFRPNPAHAVSGGLIMPGATEPDVVEVSDDDVVAMKLTRTDADIANFYWVRAPVFDLNSDISRLLASVTSSERETIDLSEYPNAAQRLYGVRLMEQNTQMGGDDVSTFQSGRPAREHDQRNIRMVDWIRERRRQLVEQNKDNVILESGTMRLRGNEKLRPGMTLRLRRGSMVAEYYVTQVAHEYLPFRTFMTDVKVERGTGFVERIQRGGAPYLSEMIETQRNG